MAGKQWRRLYNKGKELYKQCEQKSNPEVLSSAIIYFQKALALCPSGHSKRSTTLDSLGVALGARYTREGNVDDVSLAIKCHQEALTLRPAGDPERSITLNNLGKALGDRYDREGNLADLSLAIKYLQEDLRLCPVGHPGRSATLNDLALALRTRYNRDVNMADLSLAIEFHQEDLGLCPVGHPDRSPTLNNLALALRTRYDRDGDVADLSLAIKLHQEDLGLCPVGHPGRSTTLGNLALALKTRYDREGNVADLSLAIKYYQEALSIYPVGNPGRSGSLNNLGCALGMRYDRDGNAADLSRAIECHHEALKLHPSGHPERCISLLNLGFVLWTRHEKEGHSDDDLAQAVSYQQEALRLLPPGHHYRSLSLHYLANALETRCERKSEWEGLSKVIMYRQECLNLRAPGHPDRSTTLRCFASSLWNARYKRGGGGDHSFDLDLHDTDMYSRGSRLLDPPERLPISHNAPDSSTSRIISLLREASQSDNCSPRDWLRATLDWIKYSKVIDPDSTMEAYTSAFQQLDMVLALGQSLEHRQERLFSDDLMKKARDLGDEAATWALQRGEPERAIEFLEQGRSLLLAQLGRYRVELDELRQMDSELADRFEILSRRLDSSLVSNAQIEGERSTASDPYERYRQVSSEWNATVDKIRTLPNFDTFLKPLPYEQLREAAAEGPIIVIIPAKKRSNALIVCEHAPIHRIRLPLANSGRLTEFSNNILYSLTADEAEGNRAEGMCLANVKSLWNDVVGPIARALQHELGVPLGSRVWWCPTSMTSFLPLHAAGLYSQGKSGENFPNLYTSSYTPTIHALLRARRRATVSEQKTLLVVAQPNAPGKPPLRYAMEEAAVIEKMVSLTRDVELLSAKAGTCEAVQCQMKTHPWMHFICHGIQADGQPLDSYLLLHDGPLTLRMIIEQNLPNADFAFLSACHSAAGDKVLANEALHLAAAMQFAGFRGVVGTLWEMADENGPPLAEAFYREMMKHGDSRGAAKALSRAVKQLRRNRVPLNLWMRFVHIGI